MPQAIVTDELRKILEEARARPMTAEDDRVTRAVVDEAARRMTAAGTR